MTQSKRSSLLESLANVFSGMLIGFAVSQLAHEYQAEIRNYIWPGFTWEVSATSNLFMMWVLAVVSILRSYFWRRMFNSRFATRKSLENQP